MSRFSLDSLLGLYSIPSIGPTRMRKLISVLGSPEQVLNAGMRRLKQVDGIDRKTAEKIISGPDASFVATQLQRIRDYNIEILTYWDDAYPARLKQIYDPPVFLFCKGQLELLTKPLFAVVGTRLPTSYGRMITQRFSAELAKAGFSIISGFARGVDTLAHQTALKEGSGTIAVLGNGLDQIYPPENKKLFDRMVQEGLFVTEYHLGTKPDAGNFPKRNRIISGMSSGVLVTEAGAKSGALLTAMYANDQNREVFAVPGSIQSANSAGTNRLIQSGAKLVQTVDDILNELEGQLSLPLSTEKETRPAPALDGMYKKVFDVLDSEPLHVDQIALRTELTPAETLNALLTLELGGLIRQMAGKMFIRL